MIYHHLVCASDALDKKGNPMSLETFNFSPKEVLQLITLEDYILFLTYTLGTIYTSMYACIKHMSSYLINT